MSVLSEIAILTYLGSGIWSYTLRKAGAILFVNVPATIIQSDCLGLARGIIPIRSRSYLHKKKKKVNTDSRNEHEEHAARSFTKALLSYKNTHYLAAYTCIISTAQQARPKVMGHKEPFLAQFMIPSSLEMTTSGRFWGGACCLFNTEPKCFVRLIPVFAKDICIYNHSCLASATTSLLRFSPRPIQLEIPAPNKDGTELSGPNGPRREMLFWSRKLVIWSVMVDSPSLAEFGARSAIKVCCCA